MKKYCYISVLNTLIASLGLASIFYICREPFGAMFTSEPLVMEYFTSIVWVYFLLMPFDHLQTVLSRGILISFGHQRFIAASLAFACYMVGTPLIVFFTFKTDIGPIGILYSFLSFAVLNFIISAAKICSLDLKREVERAAWRADETTHLADSPTDSNKSFENGYTDELTPLTGSKSFMNPVRVGLTFGLAIILLVILSF